MLRSGAGRTVEQLADLLPGRTADAVRRRRQEIGLSVRQRVIDRARLRELHAQGQTTPEIAEALGATLRTVQQLLFEERMKANRRRA